MSLLVIFSADCVGIETRPLGPDGLLGSKRRLIVAPDDSSSRDVRVEECIARRERAQTPLLLSFGRVLAQAVTPAGLNDLAASGVPTTGHARVPDHATYGSSQPFRKY